MLLTNTKGKKLKKKGDTKGKIKGEYYKGSILIQENQALILVHHDFMLFDTVFYGSKETRLK